jgi:hypothetical protein
MCVIPALGRMRQDDFEFKSSWGYTLKDRLKSQERKDLVYLRQVFSMCSSGCPRTCSVDQITFQLQRPTTSALWRWDRRYAPLCLAGLFIYCKLGRHAIFHRWATRIILDGIHKQLNSLSLISGYSWFKTPYYGGMNPCNLGILLLKVG